MMFYQGRHRPAFFHIQKLNSIFSCRLDRDHRTIAHPQIHFRQKALFKIHGKAIRAISRVHADHQNGCAQGSRSTLSSAWKTVSRTRERHAFGASPLHEGSLIRGGDARRISGNMTHPMFPCAAILVRNPSSSKRWMAGFTM